MIEIELRLPIPADESAITMIDAEGLATGHASFRDQPHDWASFQASFLNGRGLALVAEDRTGVVAWAGVSPTSMRPVYNGVGEISVYVAPSRHGLGIGCRLLKMLFLNAESAGYWTLVAQIFPENKASLSLHTSLGFHLVGTRRKLGKMAYGPLAGSWRDVVMLERRCSDQV